MSENLRTIGRQASENYENHKFAASVLEEVQSEPEQLAEDLQWAKERQNMAQDLVSEGRGTFNRVRRANKSVENLQKDIEEYPERLAKVEQRVESQLGANTLHLAEHEEAYHDLAAIDAHLDGVKLNVDHPLHNQVPEQTQEPAAKV